MPLHPLTRALLVSLPLAALTPACQGIRPVAEPVERQELEVVVRIDPEVRSFLSEADAVRFERIAAERVLARADCGLRFYPVAASEYEKDDARPELLLTVELGDLRVRLAESKPKDGEPVEPVRRVDRLDCLAEATLQRRRPQGPPLLVASTRGSGDVVVREASVRLGANPPLALAGEAGAAVEEATLTDAIDRAVVAALRGLLEPVDRERAEATSPS